MELDEKTLKGSWTTDDNNFPEFFIINEALISKLCILGENVEPCFEGAGIAAQFSLDENFKTTLFSKIEELKAILDKGGFTQMDENENKIPEGEELPVEDTEFKKKNEDDEEDKSADEEKNDADEKDEEEAAEDDEDEDEDDEKKKKKYSLEEIPEYAELTSKYQDLEQKYNALMEEIEPLRQFKLTAEKAQKQAMIDSFYMLSDEDKADVIANIDTYSLDDIEAKLAIICVRNKVSFDLDDDKTTGEDSQKLSYSLSDQDNDSDSAPAWSKAVRATAKNM
jgi:hypothetical protein